MMDSLITKEFPDTFLWMNVISRAAKVACQEWTNENLKNDLESMLQRILADAEHLASYGITRK